MLNEGHVGGIALAIEINVALERWDDAVAALRSLADADVPNKQRRIALLGAADFLERKKGDPSAALTELRRIEELGRIVGTSSSWQPPVPQRVLFNQAVGERRPIHSYGRRAAEPIEVFDRLLSKLRSAVHAGAR